MARDPTALTLLEQQVMQAIRKQHPNAYGVSIADLIEEATGKRQSIGPIYNALSRLSGDGLLKSREGDPSPERGGRKKTFFELTGAGRSALLESEKSFDALRGAADGGRLSWA
ncbi:PadR family transcriptional regulator [Methylobacterium sp. DB1607]|nr:PadR family transcriptional regulator [Methylobacterium sp. DB1607]